MPVNFTNNNTAVFLVFNDIFCVARFNADVVNHLFYVQDVPINKKVTIVSISKIGTDFYLVTKEVIVTENLIVKLNPENKTLQDINDYLNSL